MSGSFHTLASLIPFMHVQRSFRLCMCNAQLHSQHKTSREFILHFHPYKSRSTNSCLFRFSLMKWWIYLNIYSAWYYISRGCFMPDWKLRGCYRIHRKHNLGIAYVSAQRPIPAYSTYTSRPASSIFITHDVIFVGYKEWHCPRPSPWIVW